MLESQTRFLKYLPRPMILTSESEAMNFQMCIWLHGHLTNAIRFLFTLYKSHGREEGVFLFKFTLSCIESVLHIFNFDFYKLDIC